MLRPLAPLLAVAALACAPSEREQPAADPMAAPAGALPDAAMAAASREVPGVRIDHVARLADGRRGFAANGRQIDGAPVAMTLTLAADGWMAAEVVRDIRWQEVPAAVRAAAAQRDPTFQPARVQETRRPGGDARYALYPRGENARPAFTVLLEGGAARVAG